MNMSRRLFLGGAIATVGAAALPKALAATPTIWCDGLHDDWAGIDALWNGRPARIMTDTIQVRPDGLVEMVGGVFRLSRTLRVIGGGPSIRMLRSKLTWTEPVDYCIYFERGETLTESIEIHDNYFVAHGQQSRGSP